jgi:hypothetical protein
VEAIVKRLLPPILIVAVFLVVIYVSNYVPFLPLVSVELKTTTITNTRTTVVETKVYRASMTATVLWSTVTTSMGGRTVTVPIPLSAVFSDVVKTYTIRTSVLWTEVTTATYSSSTTRQQTIVGTTPVLLFLLVVAFMTGSIIVYLRQKGAIGESIA